MPQRGDHIWQDPGRVSTTTIESTNFCSIFTTNNNRLTFALCFPQHVQNKVQNVLRAAQKHFSDNRNLDKHNLTNTLNDAVPLCPYFLERSHFLEGRNFWSPSFFLRNKGESDSHQSSPPVAFYSCRTSRSWGSTSRRRGRSRWRTGTWPPSVLTALRRSRTNLWNKWGFNKERCSKKACLNPFKRRQSTGSRWRDVNIIGCRFHRPPRRRPPSSPPPRSAWRSRLL